MPYFAENKRLAEKLLKTGDLIPDWISPRRGICVSPISQNWLNAGKRKARRYLKNS
jgi:hypothetical protein